MKLELPISELKNMVVKQIANFFFCTSEEKVLIKETVDDALNASEYCFSHSNTSYYQKDGEVYFNPFHSGQYAIFLYFLSNIFFKKHPNFRTVADRIYYLNKALNSVELFYEVELPAIFFADHPIGSVMGRAKYGDFFSYAQNCSVGNNKGIYPLIGQNVRMAAGSTIFGNCNIGDNVIISAHTYIKDTNIPACSIVFGVYPNLVIKQKNEAYFRSEIVYYKGYKNWN